MKRFLMMLLAMALLLVVASWVIHLLAFVVLMFAPLLIGGAIGYVHGRRAERRRVAKRKAAERLDV